MIHDGNAEAGPSGTHSRTSTSSSSGFASPSRLPGPSPTNHEHLVSSFGVPLVDGLPQQGNGGPAYEQTALPPVVVRSISGPELVPTVVGPDGIRQVPRLFELCQVDDLITLISSMLERLIKHNDRIPLTPTSLTRFHSRAPPSINVPDYLLRIARYTNVESAVLLSLLPYVDKVCARLPTFTVSSLTVHRFVIAGVSVGSKALSDSFCTNGRYSRVGGVSVAEMNLLEKEFCEAIDWRLVTTGPVLAHYYTSLVHSHPMYRLPPSPVPSPLTLASLPPPTPMDIDPLHLSSSTSSSPNSNLPKLMKSPEKDKIESPDLIPTSRLVKKPKRIVSASNLPSPVGGVRSLPVELGSGSVGVEGDEDGDEDEDGDYEEEEEEEEGGEYRGGEDDSDLYDSESPSHSLSSLSIVSPNSTPHPNLTTNSNHKGPGGLANSSSTSSSPNVVTRPSSLHNMTVADGSTPSPVVNGRLGTQEKRLSPLVGGT